MIFRGPLLIAEKTKTKVPKKPKQALQIYKFIGIILLMKHVKNGKN